MTNVDQIIDVAGQLARAIEKERPAESYLILQLNETLLAQLKRIADLEVEVMTLKLAPAEKAIAYGVWRADGKELKMFQHWPASANLGALVMPYEDGFLWTNCHGRFSKCSTLDEAVEMAEKSLSHGNETRFDRSAIAHLLSPTHQQATIPIPPGATIIE